MRSKKQTIEDVDKLLVTVFEDATPAVWDKIPSWDLGFIDYPSYSEVIRCLIDNYGYTERYIAQLINDCKRYNLNSSDNKAWDDEEFEKPGDLISAIKYNIINSIDVNEGDADYRREEYEKWEEEMDECREEESEEDVIPTDIAVSKFIKRFQNEGTIKTFTEGCCYWFAKILDERFNWNSPESGIMYNSVDNHFATWIEGKLYDITGEIPMTSDWVSWEDYQHAGDELVVERLYRDCIDF